jgi:outer membrane lipoprotein
MNARKCIVPVLMLAMLPGCATYYPIARNLREEAKPLTLSQVKEDPDGTRGAIVIWGGEILGVVNNSNSGAIYIMQLPLDENGKPMRDAAPTGRFIATSDFLDPQEYVPGFLITVAGEVTGIQTEWLQNIQYTYPVVDIKDVHVWPMLPIGYESYGTPGWYVAPDWWWDGGQFYPYPYPYYYPSCYYERGYRGGFHEGYGGSEEHAGFGGHTGDGGGHGR